MFGIGVAIDRLRRRKKEENIMSTVTNVESTSPRPPFVQKSSFQQSGGAFENTLIAAADSQPRRKGLAAPAPARASALELPPASINFKPKTTTPAPSSIGLFRPLPLAGNTQISPTIIAQPVSPTATQSAPVTVPQAASEGLAEQVISDYKEYQQLMDSKPQANPVSSQAISESADLRPTSPLPASPETAIPYGQAMAQSEESSIVQEPSITASFREPRSPFPILTTPVTPTTPAVSVASSAPVTAAVAETESPQPVQKTPIGEALAAYKDEQLLSNAGGDNYIRNGETMEINPDYDHTQFSQRVGKDLTDAKENLKDAVGDLSTGSITHYRDESGEIQARKRPGLFKTLGNFGKDIASGLTLGIYRPNGDEAPTGLSRVTYPFKKVFVDGVMKDLVIGVPNSLIHAGEHTTLAALNTGEALPDATIGTAPAGRQLTTSTFDNTQVGASYVADVMPSGEAWGRVGAAGQDGNWGMPIATNWKASEYNTTDPRFLGVRNTGFRKGIETIGTLGMGAAVAAANAPVAAVAGVAAMNPGTSEIPSEELIQKEPSSPMPSPAEMDPELAAALEALYKAREKQAPGFTQTDSSFTASAAANRRPKLWQNP